MFVLKADKTQLHVSQYERKPVTSGSVKVYQARFEFSPDWDGMERVVVFRAGGESRFVLLDDTNLCDVPWEVLKQPKFDLVVGVYGSKDGEVVLPTVWARLCYIQVGCEVGEEAKPPTQDLWQQELAAKQDKLRGAPGQVVGFDEDGNAVPQDASGGGGEGIPGPPGPQGPQRVRMDDGRTDTWEARKDQCDGYALEVGAFVVKKDGEAVGVYSLAHMISAVIE